MLYPSYPIICMLYAPGKSQHMQNGVLLLQFPVTYFTLSMGRTDQKGLWGSPCTCTTFGVGPLDKPPNYLPSQVLPQHPP